MSLLSPFSCPVLDALQEALLAYQRHFLWEGGSEDGGVIANVERELSIRAAIMHDTPHSVLTKRRLLSEAVAPKQI